MLSGNATANDGQRHSAWVVADPFCAMRHVSDPRYLPGDEKSREHTKLNRRRTNVQLGCAAPRPRADNRKQNILHLFTLRNNKAGEELLVDCGMKYLFS